MLKKWKTRRLLAMLLAILLTFTTVGMDGAKVYAEGIEGQTAEAGGENGDSGEEQQAQTGGQGENVPTEEGSISGDPNGEVGNTEGQATEESNEGLLVCDWYDWEKQQFNRFGNDGDNAWSEYGKYREMTAGESRLLSFAYCPTDSVEITEKDGEYSDNLVILEPEEGWFEIKRENGGNFGDITDEASIYYDTERQSWCFAAHVASTYRIYINNEDAVPAGSNYIVFEVCPQTKHYGLYKDSGCEEEYRQDEQPYAGDTVYAKVWTDAGDTDELTIVGYIFDWENWWDAENNRPNHYETESKGGFEYSYNSETGVASLTLPDLGYDYDFAFAVERKFGQDNEESEIWDEQQLHNRAIQSVKGLVLCNNGDPGRGFVDCGGEDSFYGKNTGLGVKDEMCFLLAVNENDDFRFDWVDDKWGTVVSKLEGAEEKFSVLKYNEEKQDYEAVDDAQVSFGYREAEDGREGHYYFRAEDCGIYKLLYNDEAVDEGRNFVTIEVSMQRIALFTSKDNFGPGELYADYDIFVTGETEYYLRIDNEDPNYKIDDKYIIIMESGNEKQYSFNKDDGKFYKKSFVNGEWNIESTATDLSEYLSLTPVDGNDNLYKVVFKPKEYDIDFLIKGTHYEDISEPERGSWDERDERSYGIRISKAGELVVLDWLDGFENAWGDGAFNPEALRAGRDEFNPDNYARFYSDPSYRISRYEQYVVLGIAKDAFGEEADVISGDAEVKVYKYNKSWIDVTDKVNPIYVGKADSENWVAQGLWKLNVNEVGDYKAVVTIGDKDYPLEYKVTLPEIALYTKSTGFGADTLVYDEVRQIPYAENEVHYYLYAHDFDRNIDGTVSAIEINWPEWSEGGGWTRLEYDSDSKTFEYVDGFVPSMCEGKNDDIIKSICEIKQISESMYDIFPWPNGCEVRFFAEFEDPNDPWWHNETDISYWFNSSDKGLVACDNGDPYDRGFELINENGDICLSKYLDTTVGDMRFFELYINGNDSFDYKQSGDLFIPDVEKLNGKVNDIVIQKQIGENEFEPASKADYEFGYKYDHITPDNNNPDVYCAHYYFKALKEGTYRIVYNGSGLGNDINYITINAGYHLFGFYSADALEGNIYNFNDENILSMSIDNPLTAKQAIEGKAEFYLVINGDNYDLSTVDYEVEQEYWINKDNETPEEGSFFEKIISSSNPSLQSNEYNTYEQVNVSGKTVKIGGQEIENAIVYKITSTRDGNPGLSSRKFNVRAWDKEDPDFIVDWNDFMFSPADISGAEVTASNVPMELEMNQVTRDYEPVPVELDKENVTVEVDGIIINNPYLYTITDDYWDEEEGEMIEGNVMYITQHTLPGTVEFRVNGLWDCTGSAVGSFKIEKYDVSSLKDPIAYAKYSKAKGGLVATQLPYELDAFEEGIDYEISFNNNAVDDCLETGKTSITVEALSDSDYLTGSKTFDATYTPCGDFETPNLGEAFYMQYDGTVKEFNFDVMCDGELLEEGVDYTIGLPSGSPKDVAIEGYAVLIVGKGWYEKCGTLSKILYITPVNISKATVSGVPSKIAYGTSVDDMAAGVKVTFNKQELVYGTEWKLTCDTTKAGNQSLSISGIGNYTGTISKAVTVAPDTTLNATGYRVIQSNEDVFEYPNKPETGDFKVQMKKTDGTFEDIDAACYTILLSSTDKPGAVTVTAQGNAEEGYSGAVSLKVDYKAKSITKDMLGNLDGKTFAYTCGGKQLDALFGNNSSDADFVLGKAYTVKYTGDTKAGTATATVTGIGNYTGTVTYTYTINKLDLAAEGDSIEVRNIKAPGDKYYAEKKGDAVDILTSDFAVYYVSGENEYLISASDYTVTASTKTYTAGTTSEPNKYSFTISGKNNCEGTISHEVSAYALERTDISKGYEIRVDGYSAPFAYEYGEKTSNAIKNAVKLYKDGEQAAGVSYDVTVANVYNAGKGSIIVTGTGDYTGVVTADVNITPYKVSVGDPRIKIESSQNEYVISPKGKVDYGTIGITFDDEYVEPSNYTYSFSAAKVADGSDISLTVNYKGNFEKAKVVYDANALEVLGFNSWTLTGSSLSGGDSDTSILGTQSYIYTGSAIVPKFTVKSYGQTLKMNTDYTLSFRKCGGSDYVTDLKDVGEYYVRLQGVGKYSDAYENETFVVNVTQASVEKATVTMEKSTYKFNPEDTDGYGVVKSVKLGKVELIEDKDYVVDFENNRKPGTATAIITGIGSYSGTVKKTFNIDGKVDINDAYVYHIEPEAQYNPKGAVPNTYLTYNDEILVYNQDYTIAVSANSKNITAEGEYAVATIKGKGKYTGTMTTQYEFAVVPCEVTNDYEGLAYSNAKLLTSYDPSGEKYSSEYASGSNYNGKAQTYDPKVKVDGATLKIGTDYDVYYVPQKVFTENYSSAFDFSQYTSFTDAGNYLAVIKFKGNYTGSVYMPYFVAPMNVSKLKVTTKGVDYTGQRPDGIIDAVTSGNDSLTNGTDYIVYQDKVYENSYGSFTVVGMYAFDREEIKKTLKLDIPWVNPNGTVFNDNNGYCVGSHKAYIVGQGNYCGVKEVKYDILGPDIKKLNISVEDAVYGPGETYPKIIGSYTDDNGITSTYEYDIKNGKRDFNVSFSNNTKAGTAKAVITHKLFKGSKTVSFKIKPYEVKLGEGFVNSYVADEAEFDSKGAKLNAEFYEHSYYLVEGKDYTVAYKNNKSVTTDGRKATATFKFKGNYTGSITQEFDIHQMSIEDCNVVLKGGSSWKPSVKITSVSGAALKEKTDYTVKYTYNKDVTVKCGKSYVKRNKGDEVNAKDVVPMGTEIKADFIGNGNYKEYATYIFIYAGKNTEFRRVIES